MELVDGPTLADRIQQGAIPVSDALPIARQIIDAIDAAHEQGIVHRDLKPANIKLKAPGAPPPGASEDDRLERRLSAVDVADCTVKVLDFGLAKAIEPAGNSSTNASMSPTLTTPAMTMGGVILGTAAYMAPEQAKGRQVDRRADIWAFGCVLFEMLAGTRAFPGDDVSDTLATILKSDPDWAALPADVSRSVRQAIRLCLEKDPRKRVRDITAVRLVMDGASDAPQVDAPRSEVARGGGRRTLAWAAAALVAGALGAGVGVRQLQPAIEKPLAHLS